ncbi:MAG: hypothetical protein ACE5G9_13680 [Nitrospinales bacterium]
MSIDWNDFKYFSEDEFRPPGFDGALPMGAGFLLKLETLRQHVGSPVVIHANGGFAVRGHAENSLHYMGLAADLHIRQGENAAGNDPASPRDIVEQALLAYKWTFLSIGIYPFWNRPGLHLDDRTAIGKAKAVWFRDRQGNYHFYPYDQFHRCIRELTLLVSAEGEA